MRTLVIALVVGMISGCAPVAQKPAAPVAYRCEDGRDFTLAVAPSGETAIVNLSGMSFQLLREPASSGTRFSCSVLTVWRQGDVTEVQMENEQFLRNCRPAPPL